MGLPSQQEFAQVIGFFQTAEDDMFSARGRAYIGVPILWELARHDQVLAAQAANFKKSKN